MIFLNGVTGSLGRYLLESIKDAKESHHVIKTRLENAKQLAEELPQKLPPVSGDAVTLFHLAGMVPVVQCQENPEKAHQINVDFAREYVEKFVAWARRLSKEPKVVYVSSGHVYAKPNGEERIAENNPLLPRSVYAETKMKAEKTLTALAHEVGFSLTIARVFGLVAPVQPHFYVLQGLIRRAHEQDFRGVPGLHAYRDYLDARDVSRVLTSLAEQNVTGVVNVCSGEGVSIGALLALVVQALYGHEASSLIENFTAAPERPDGVPYLVGNNELLQKQLGILGRTIAIEKTIQDALEVYERL